MEEDALTQWNALTPDAAAQAILPCCGSFAWARCMAKQRPIRNAEQLLEIAGEVWRGLPEGDWQDAFQSHPRIGERTAPPGATARSSAWSAEEQRSATTPDAAEQLASANHRYEQRFGRTFLICATGKTAPEILVALEERLGNDALTELWIAAEEQQRITELRLRQWMAEGSL